MGWRETQPLLVVALVLTGLATATAGCDDDGTPTDADGDVDADGLDGGSDAGDVDADADADRDLTHCEALTAGMNDGFPVGELERSFILDLPEAVDDDGPWAVVFAWHGLYRDAAEMHDFLEYIVDNDDMPFIGVSPEDSDYYMLGYLMDWDTAWVEADNREAALFDEILLCLDARWGVGRDRIYSVGVSMGGFVTDMLGTIRGEQLAANVSFSGGYGSNETNLSGTLGMVVSWPEHDVENKYVQVIAHGGPADYLNLDAFSVDFYDFALNDTVYLNDRGHDVILCNHGIGHAVPGGLTGQFLVDFFSEHPLGTNPSAWAEGFPPSVPDYCDFYSGSSR